MKILHILSTPRAEGTPNLVLDWLATGSHEQEVFVLNSQPADLTERLQSGARWYEEADYFSRGKRKFTDIARGVYRVCRERKPDLVLCWPTGFANWACLGAYLAGVKRLLVHCGNPPNHGFRGDWMSRYGFWPLAALGAKCVCCSDYVKRQYQSIPAIPDSLFYSVWNCVRAAEVAERAALSRASAPLRSSPTAIMVATLEAHKDHTTLLRSMPRILEKIPDFRLLLAGDGSLREELKDTARLLGVSESVDFLGMRLDVPELLGRADLFVFATTPQEGLGSVLLEGLAAGLPIVASDVPACGELLGNGEHGILVPGNDEEVLAEAIIQILREQPCKGEDSKSVDYALAFTAERMMKQYLRIAGFSDATDD